MLKVKCHAHTQVGAPCGHYPMRGQRVCHVHGGKAPQALAKAKDRLLALEHPAITALGVLIASGDFQAVRWLLEVLGHKATLQVQTDEQAERDRIARALDTLIGITAMVVGPDPQISTNGAVVREIDECWLVYWRKRDPHAA